MQHFGKSNRFGVLTDDFASYGICLGCAGDPKPDRCAGNSVVLNCEGSRSWGRRYSPVPYPGFCHSAVPSAAAAACQTGYEVRFLIDYYGHSNSLELLCPNRKVLKLLCCFFCFYLV